MLSVHLLQVNRSSMTFLARQAFAKQFKVFRHKTQGSRSIRRVDAGYTVAAPALTFRSF